MTTLITTKIQTTDVDELVEALQMLRSWASMDDRPVVCQAWSNYVEVLIGPAGEVPMVEVGDRVDEHVTVDPRLDPLDPPMPDPHDDVPQTSGVDMPDTCGADSPAGDWCTRLEGHEGEHVVEADGRIVEHWVDAAPDETPETYTVDPAPAAGPGPASDPDGSKACPGCELPFRTGRAVSDHIRAAHWDDVIATFAGSGAKGIVTDWGVTRGTAYAWAKVIRGEA